MSPVACTNPSSTWPPRFLALPVRRSSFMSVFLLRFRISTVARESRSLPRAKRQTDDLHFIRKATLSSPDRAWQDVLQSFDAARDEWSAMEAVVHLELLLEARGLLIEQGTAYASRSGQGRSRAA